MRRHCLSSRRGGWSLWQRRNCSCPSRYASIRTFYEPTLRWLGAYDEIRLDSGSTKALQSSERPLFLSDGTSPYAQSPLEIRSDRASRARPPLSRVVTAAMPVAFTSSVRIFRCYSMASVVLSRLLLCASMGVVERLVVLCCNPEAMKQHRELPRYGHHRSFVGVLGSPRGYLLSVTP